jgi:hypothetical protein
MSATLGTREALLQRAEDNLRRSRRLAAERLEIAAAWARRHRFDAERDHPRHCSTIGGIGYRVQSFASAELAGCLELHPRGAEALMADALDLQERFPQVWQAVLDLRLESWLARKIVGKARELSNDQARSVDIGLVDHLDLAPSRLLDLTDARVMAADTAAADRKAVEARRRTLVHLSRESEHGTRNIFIRCDAADAQRFADTIDEIAEKLAQVSDEADDSDVETMDQLRARAVGILADPAGAQAFLEGKDPARGKSIVYVHLTPDFLASGSGVARVEDLGPYTRSMLIRLLGHEHVTVKPVIDLADQVVSDRYEVPADIAERLRLVRPYDVFPYASGVPGAGGRGMDQDHTIPYDRHGPPGQTRVDNLGYLNRRHHRIKTLDRGWEVEQLSGGRFLWRSPSGRYHLVDGRGTHKVNPARNNCRVELYAGELLLRAA